MTTTTQKQTADSVLTDELIALSVGGPPVLPHLDIYQAAAYAAQSVKRDRIQQTKDQSVGVGVFSASYAETTLKTDNTTITQNGLTPEVMDLTSYPDRAMIRLKNNLGFDVYLTRFQIMGNRIQQSNGKAGSLLLDSLKHDADIRRNGEIVKNISNEYIFDGTQVAKIADYWYKRCGEKKHIYALQIKGTALYYEPGERYTLQLGEAGTNEYIDSTVEVYKVDVTRDAGGIGSTSLLVQECFESWGKTTLYTARLVTGAGPKRRSNQSNILIVASSSFDGTYDYRCDGTDDDVQIQAAIDYLSDTFGGGTVRLTAGTFIMNGFLTIKSNVTVCGVGPGTIIRRPVATGTAIISMERQTMASLRSVNIDGTGTTYTRTSGLCIINGSSSVNCSLSDILISNFTFSASSASPIEVWGVAVVDSMDNVVIDGLYATNTTQNMIVHGIHQCDRVAGCRIKNISSTANSGIANIDAFSSCNFVSMCKATSMTLSFGVNGTSKGFGGCNNLTINLVDNSGIGSYGYVSCKSMQQNKASNVDTKYSASYADAGTANACADTAAGGYNS